MITNSLKGIFLFLGLSVLIACQSGGGKSGPSSSIVDGGHSLLGGGSPGDDFNFGASPDANNSDEIETASTPSGVMFGSSGAGGGSSGGGGGVGSLSGGREEPGDGLPGDNEVDIPSLAQITEAEAKNVFWKTQRGLSGGHQEQVYFNYIDQILNYGVPAGEDDPLAPFYGTVPDRGAGLIGAEAGQSYKAALRMAHAEAPFCLAKLATRSDLRDAVKPISGVTRDQLSRVFYQSPDRDRVIDINVKDAGAAQNTFVRIRIARKANPEDQIYRANAVSCRQTAPSLSSAFVRTGHLIQSYDRRTQAYSFNLLWKRSHSLAGRGSFSDNLNLKLNTTTLQPNLNGTYSYTNRNPIVLEVDQSADNLTYRAFEDDSHLKWTQKAKFTISAKNSVRFSSYSEVTKRDKGAITRLDRTYSEFDSTTAGRGLVNKTPTSICQALVKKSSFSGEKNNDPVNVPVDVLEGNHAEYSPNLGAYIVKSENECNGSSSVLDQFKTDGRAMMEGPTKNVNLSPHDNAGGIELPIDCSSVVVPDAVIEIQKSALPESDLKRCGGNEISEKIDNYTASAESSISEVFGIIVTQPNYTYAGGER